MAEDLTSLTAAVERLTLRVEALERNGPGDGGCPSEPSDAGGAFWALDGVKDRTTGTGEVMIVGALQLPEGPVEWQESRDTDALLDADWSDLAASFAALGHSARLEILRHILNGTHRTADLAALEHLGTTGQLHHHLRQLVAAGWVRQSGRGAYEVPVARVVPLLACMAGSGS